MDNGNFMLPYDNCDNFDRLKKDAQDIVNSLQKLCFHQQLALHISFYHILFIFFFVIYVSLKDLLPSQQLLPN